MSKGNMEWETNTWTGEAASSIVIIGCYFCYHSFGVFVDITAAWQQTQKCVYKKKKEALKVQLLLEHFDPTHGQRIHL